MEPEFRSEEDRSLTRRRLLRWGGVGGLVALSGCTEEIGEEFPPNAKAPVSDLVPNLPVRKTSDVLSERIAELSGAEIADADEFAAAFEEYALAVETVERERDVLTIKYVNTWHRAEGNVHDVGLIAGAYASLVDAGYDATALGITVLDDAPASFGSASVETEWAERFNAGGLSAKEYGELVVTTIESQRESPDVEVSPDE